MRDWFPYRVICWPSMNVRAAQDAYAALHEKAPWHDGTFTQWSTKRDAAHPFHRDSGVRIGVADRDLAPWDNFTTEVDASPLPPPDSDLVADQPVGDVKH